jgi:tetratricopeptide (TPR) repeat protein
MDRKRTSISSSYYYYLPPVLVGIITTLVYMPSWHYAFQFDDIVNIQKHFNLRHYTFFDLFFTGSRWISYWLNALHYSIGKFDPFSYRVGNIIIHVTNGMLVFLVIFYALSRIKKATFFSLHSFALAFMTSTLFLLHPVQTQTVSYVIQGELEGMATLFSLITIFMFLLYANARTQMIRGLLVACMYLVAFFACGTKEITIVLPFLLLLIDWWFVAQGSWPQLKQRAWLHLSIFGLIFSAYLYLLKPKFFYDLFGLKMAVKNNIGNVLTHNPAIQITPYYFFISQFKVVLHYLWIFIWPFAISVEYDWKLAKRLFAADCILPLMLLLCIGTFIFRVLKRNTIHPFCFGVLWFAICIAPRSSFMPSSELLADYKTYLASVGWLFIIAAALIKGFEYGVKTFRYPFMTRAWAQTVFVLLFAVPLGYCTMQRNIVWSSGLEFWGNVIKNAPNKARAYNNYGVELAQEHGKLDESVPYFQKAIAMDKNYSDPCNNLAVIYARTNNPDGAIEVLTKSLKINPHYPEGYNNLASIFLDKKEYDKARSALLQAISYRPHYGKALYNLGRVYTAEGDHLTAWEYYKKCCMQADLDNEAGFNMYAQASFELKKFDDAIGAYKKVIEINPNNFPAIFRIGNAYYHADNFAQALVWYHKAEQKKSDDVGVLFNLGETYIKLSQPEKALGYYQKVQHATVKIPHVGLRLAECYRTLGEYAKAHEVLVAIGKKNEIPEYIKVAALSMMDQPNNKVINVNLI